MEITLLIKSIMGLVVVLALLMFLFISSQNEKKAKAEKAKKNAAKKVTTSSKKEALDLISLSKIIKNKQSSSKELKEALDLILKHYGNIHKKLGARPHPDFDIYMGILMQICKHPNTNKHLIIDFDKELTRLNPQYKKEIYEAVTKGLNSRGV